MSEAYTVSDIVERRSLSKEGKVLKTYRIAAVTATGTLFTVEVDEPDFSKLKVDKVLRAKASLLDEIKLL